MILNKFTVFKMNIYENFINIKKEIESTALKAGRNPSEIEVIAVSKTFPASVIQEAIDSGIILFGENKLQEALSKIPELNGDFVFHFVGHLQSNKARDAVKYFNLIHSIDKLSTAQKVNKEAEKIDKFQKILVQVNTSGEETKSGIQPSMALNLCKDIMELKNIFLQGLMTVGPLTDNTDRIRSSFKLLKDLLQEINLKLGTNLTELSMGMSSDFPIAVEEGATMLRIGSIIFGKRSYSGNYA